jgi:N-acylneuraminate cytidylyltransferase
MKYLFVIPARGGSKGIPYKNIKVLCGKPLIEYSIDVARAITTDDNICVTTDDNDIIRVVEEYGLKVPFVRPSFLATDTCGTYEVLLHTIDFYESQGKFYDALVLLQPTTPFRTANHIIESISLYNKDIDMVMSVKESSANPYYNCFEEDENGFLHISKGTGDFIRRQDVPKVWECTGAIYVINIESLKRESLSTFSKVQKYEMNSLNSLDIDSPVDWIIAESILNTNVTHS